MIMTIGASRIEVDTFGTHGDAVVLLPALGMTRKMWRAQTRVLSDSYRVFAYNQSAPWNGHRERTFKDLSLELSCLMDSLGIDRAHLIGVSMGGMIAQDFAARNSGRVMSLILACTTARQSAAGRQRMESCAETADRAGMVPLIEPTIQRWFTPAFISRCPEVIDWVKELIGQVDPAVYAALARAVARVDTLTELASISVPTLVLRGDQDLAIEPEAACLLHSRIVGSQCVVVPMAGHMCNIEQHSAFNKEIVAFLELSGRRKT